jgi:hypothetical protein
MNKQTRFLKNAALAVAMTGLSSAATASELKFADEVDSCIAAVTSTLDLSDADRVRHIVTEKNHTGIGYVLTIETSVYSTDSEKSYEAYCVADGTRAPVKFRIHEVST